MPSKYSIYALTEADQPEWLPGEKLAATAFVAMTFLLMVEINIAISRAFRHRRGYYYWAVQIGSIGILVDNFGIIPKYLANDFKNAYPFYTLCQSVGWAVFVTCQLTTLYSRLHLVSQNRKLQRAILMMIIIVSPLLILADWITTWPSWNPKPELTNKWSPAQAIVERITQLGFSTMEIIINSTYAISLLSLLKVKSNVRQRRVMLDLLYVNIISASFDLLNITLFYVNRVGVSHPIQTFTYALKLRLEFLVLNQLMAVAARGLHRETFAEKRYHDLPSIDGSTLQNGSSKPSGKQGFEDSIELSPKEPMRGQNSVEITAPPPAAAKDGSAKYGSAVKSSFEKLLPWKKNDDTASEEPQVMSAKLKHGKSGKSKHGRWKNDDDEPDEDEIRIHMWEKKNGQKMLEIPWFRSDVHGA